MFEVAIEHTFAAGHALRHYKGKCENVHGHNYKVQVVVRGENIDRKTGMLADFVELKRLLRAISEPLDHVFLNDIEPFTTLEPSAENIAWYICEKMQAGITATESDRSGGSEGLGNRHSIRHLPASFRYSVQ